MSTYYFLNTFSNIQYILSSTQYSRIPLQTLPERLPLCARERDCWDTSACTSIHLSAVKCLIPRLSHFSSSALFTHSPSLFFHLLSFHLSPGSCQHSLLVSVLGFNIPFMLRVGARQEACMN